MKNFFKEILTTTLGDLKDGLLKDLLQGKKKLSETLLLERLGDVLKEDFKVDVIRVIMALDQKDAETLWERHKQAEAAGTSGEFLRALANLIPRTADGAIDGDTAKIIFTQLSQVNEPLFSTIIGMSNKAAIPQVTKTISDLSAKSGSKLGGFLRKLFADMKSILP
jgi:hypothetical protein